MTKLLTSGNSEKSELTQWISRNFSFRKCDIAPWGTYSIEVSLDGRVWAKFSPRFGYAFSIEEAFEILLTDVKFMALCGSQLQHWLGPTLYQELQQLV